MHAAPSTTALRFRLGREICHVDIALVERVVPWARLAPPPPGSPAPWVGWLACAGRRLPVIDLGQWVLQQPVPAVFSSRILILKPSQAQGRILGLLVEQLTDTHTTAGDTSGRLFDPARILGPLLPLLPPDETL